MPKEASGVELVEELFAVQSCHLLMADQDRSGRARAGWGSELGSEPFVLASLARGEQPPPHSQNRLSLIKWLLTKGQRWGLVEQQGAPFIGSGQC